MFVVVVVLGGGLSWAGYWLALPKIFIFWAGWCTWIGCWTGTRIFESLCGVTSNYLFCWLCSEFFWLLWPENNPIGSLLFCKVGWAKMLLLLDATEEGCLFPKSSPLGLAANKVVLVWNRLVVDKDSTPPVICGFESNNPPRDSEAWDSDFSYITVVSLGPKNPVCCCGCCFGSVTKVEIGDFENIEFWETFGKDVDGIELIKGLVKIVWPWLFKSRTDYVDVDDGWVLPIENMFVFYCGIVNGEFEGWFSRLESWFVFIKIFCDCWLNKVG